MEERPSARFSVGGGASTGSNARTGAAAEPHLPPAASFALRAVGCCALRDKTVWVRFALQVFPALVKVCAVL